MLAHAASEQTQSLLDEIRSFVQVPAPLSPPHSFNQVVCSAQKSSKLLRRIKKFVRVPKLLEPILEEEPCSEQCPTSSGSRPSRLPSSNRRLAKIRRFWSVPRLLPPLISDSIPSTSDDLPPCKDIVPQLKRIPEHSYDYSNAIARRKTKVERILNYFSLPPLIEALEEEKKECKNQAEEFVDQLVNNIINTSDSFNSQSSDSHQASSHNHHPPHCVDPLEINRELFAPITELAETSDLSPSPTKDVPKLTEQTNTIGACDGLSDDGFFSLEDLESNASREELGVLLEPFSAAPTPQSNAGSLFEDLSCFDFEYSDSPAFPPSPASFASSTFSASQTTTDKRRLTSRTKVFVSTVAPEKCFQSYLDKNSEHIEKKDQDEDDEEEEVQNPDLAPSMPNLLQTFEACVAAEKATQPSVANTTNKTKVKWRTPLLIPTSTTQISLPNLSLLGKIANKRSFPGRTMAIAADSRKVCQLNKLDNRKRKSPLSQPASKRSKTLESWEKSIPVAPISLKPTLAITNLKQLFRAIRPA